MNERERMKYIEDSLRHNVSKPRISRDDWFAFLAVACIWQAFFIAFLILFVL